jgi:hypothetical protein
VLGGRNTLGELIQGLEREANGRGRGLDGNQSSFAAAWAPSCRGESTPAAERDSTSWTLVAQPTFSKAFGAFSVFRHAIADESRLVKPTARTCLT